MGLLRFFILCGLVRVRRKEKEVAVSDQLDKGLNGPIAQLVRAHA